MELAKGQIEESSRYAIKMKKRATLATQLMVRAAGYMGKVKEQGQQMEQRLLSYDQPIK